jgi:4-oxalocrotonate tautomerase
MHIHINLKRNNTMPVVRVTWFEGKEAKAKEAVAKEITESIVKNTGTDASYIYVIFEDVKTSDWAGAGMLYG